MPSRPSLARTVRKDAGTETRPLVSIRLVNADTNWSISPSWAPGPTQDLDTHQARARGFGELGERGGAIPPWPLKERCRASLTHYRTGECGIAWDTMGSQGISWEQP